jgi:hypothetical protein
MKELKETGGSRIRKVDVEELRRRAARLGTFYAPFASDGLQQLY